MDASRFDHIVRAWAETGSRRPLLGALAGGAAALAGLAETSGKRKKKKKKVTLCLNGQTITVPKKQQGAYLSQGATAGKCPAACVPQCAGKTCEPDGCGGTCDNCPGDKICQGGTCACPVGDADICGSDICVPTDAECCFDFNCGTGGRCQRGRCLVWQGTCSPSADSCIAPQGCNGASGCACYQSTEGEARCGGGVEPDPPCGVCNSTADCVARFPGIPGVFCVDKGDKPGCCPGACVRPCPTQV